MKWGCLLIAIAFAVSCSENTPSNYKVDEVVENPIDSTKNGLDTSAAVISNQPPENLITLLENPIDLVAFKTEYGPSNSGGAGDIEFLDLPDTIGFLYQYMLFYKLKQALPGHPSESDLFHNFSITVYKFGDEVGHFKDTNEVLMAIECGLDNTALQALNVFGLTKSDLSDKFGEPQYTAENHVIYAFENKVLSIHINANSQKADWYKYAKLNSSVNLNESIPEFLLKKD